MPQGDLYMVTSRLKDGVVWHTGKVLAYGAVGPRFKPRQGQGGFYRAYSVLNQDGTLFQWRGELV